ncbi:hypothetical protein [Clostridium saccharobutylicum]|uniref:hypothetical protein n=1 Tax=Clostridium saccharobutylicum TaxID=169679 RepID=UPI0005A1E388|nr:hypothetical protein [Clostridium saccharobutylicum]AQR91976.1 hypothetical protein CLOSC_37040 [Clostridium saccharobutylicum]AQS01878.1 hypothetical protein CSACC_37090 [Clostridium saccharobutylicum]AQS15861.1 hypothetical protein CLOSACC_37090 [Clostridium saccharobutylicum]MBC2400273.1 hypothetical protein [Clostridium saccharobutylicum]MBC2411228.1 hypothetical protein [Clostridium saccharobutylicum]
MILSKKYKEELDKIVMNEDMKKRILVNVLNKNIEAKSTTIPKVKKYNNLKRNMQLTAACTIVVVGLSVAKSYPELLKHDNTNNEQNQVINDSDDENQIINNNNDDDENKALKNSEESKSNDTKDYSTNNNDGAKKHQIINSHIGNDEEHTKSNSINKESNIDNKESSVNKGSMDDSEKTEQSSEIEHNEKALDNSVENSSSPSKINSETQTNENNEMAKPSGFDEHSKDVINRQYKTTSNENKENNDLDSSSMRTCEDSIIEEYKTVEEAEDAVKLRINSIKLPKGFNIDNISVITNEIVQINYSNGQDCITFRAGKDIENISGDYNIYEIKNTCEVNGINVNLQENKNKVFNLATWKKDDISYSISSTNGIDEDEILNIIKSSL